jgi:oligo-alginate lyase
MSPDFFRTNGLLASSADFVRLRENVRIPGLLQEFAACVRKLAEHELGEPPVTREMEGRRLLHISRLVLRRVINCGLSYQLDHDLRLAQRAIEDLKSAAQFSDWNPSHFLDVGEMCAAFALGLDWFHDVLTDDERIHLEDAVIRLGLEAGLADPNAWFPKATNNWNAVCNGGLAMAAIAVHHRRPDLAEPLIARCIRQLPLHGENYAPDGAFIEGAMYWAYGTLYHVLAVESLLRATGSTHDLDALPGFRESADYMTHIVGPSGEFYAYFDSRANRIPLPALAWFGRHFNNALATRAEADAIRRRLSGPLDPLLWTENRAFALSLLWLNPDHLADNAAKPAPLAWSGDGPNPVAFWRHAWTPDAVWVGAKGGRATLSHGHIDAGSFVYEAGGVRWAVDLGMEEYHRLEAMGVNLWGLDRWTLFRLGAEGHSIPRIDGASPDPAGHCPRIDWTTTPNPAVTFDLTALYAGTVNRLHRTISAGDNGLTRWLDDVAGLPAGRIYRFTWLTEAVVTPEPSGALLTQGGRSLRIKTDCALPITVRVLDHTALLGPYDTPSPAICRLEFALTSTGADFRLGVSAHLA